MEQWMKNYGRYLELEDRLPELDTRIRELEEDLRESKSNRDWLELDVLDWQNPGFFQRLFGRSEEKLEAAQAKFREASIAFDALCRERDALVSEREAIQKQLTELAADVEDRRGLGQVPHPAAVAPAAIAAAQRCCQALEQARPWLQADVRGQSTHHGRISTGNRKMEFLALAASHAHRLNTLLSLMPRDTVTTGGYLAAPESYIDSVTLVYKRLDMLDEAQRQLRGIQTQLKNLL